LWGYYLSQLRQQLFIRVFQQPFPCVCSRIAPALEKSSLACSQREIEVIKIFVV
jgi:hypothetical protein